MKHLIKLLAILGIVLGPSVLGGAWSSINMSLASIQSDLGVSLLQLEWVMNLYGIAVCVSLLPMGKLGDSKGRKLFYLIGLICLFISCIIAGSAVSIGYIVFAMALFGVSASAIMALSQALIVHVYPEDQKPKAIAIWGAFTSVSLSLGPILGGTIIKYLGWRWVFYFNTFPIALAIILVWLFVQKDKTRNSTCNWNEVGLLAIIIGSLIAGILQGPSWGWVSWKIIGIFCVTLAALISFAIKDKKSQEPMFNANLFANRSFLFSSICNGCLVGFVWAIFFFVPLYLQNQLGVTPLQAGFTMLLITLPVTIFSIPVGKVYEKIDPKKLLFVGFLSLFLAVSLQSVLPSNLFSFLIGIGWVLTWGPSTMRALSSLPHKKAGMASGMFITLQEVGGVLGLAIAGVSFRTSMRKYLMPQIDTLRDSLGDETTRFLADPIEAAKHIDSSSPIIDMLHKGFDQGFSSMLFFLCILTAGAMILALLIPKRSKK